MPVLLKTVLIATAAIAGIYDLRFRRIPNWLNLSAVVLGLAINTFVFAARGLGISALGMACALGIYLPLYLVRGMGAGDVKLMAAIGAIAGPENWLRIFVVTALLGGLASLLVVALRKRFRETGGNLLLIVSELLRGRKPAQADARLDVRDPRSVGMPHGTVVAIGALAFLVFF